MASSTVETAPPVTDAAQSAPVTTPSPHGSQRGLWAPAPPGSGERESTDGLIPYARSPSRLICYLIPLPEPQLPSPKEPSANIPQRFMIYTPPPPSLTAPNDGKPKNPEPVEAEKPTYAKKTKKERIHDAKIRLRKKWQGDGKGNEETKPHRVQRWWQGHIRKAKEDPQPVKTFKGVQGRAELGIQKAMDWTKSTNIEFLLRTPSDKPDRDSDPRHWGLEEIILVYPPELRGTPEEIRAEFLRTVLATKSKAYRDSVIATGLFPVGLVIDTLCALFWPFGGLAEIAAVWAISSYRAAVTSRSLLKRIDPTGENTSGKHVKLTFLPSVKASAFQQYLNAECHAKDIIMFPKPSEVKPSEQSLLNSIGWTPAVANGKTKSFQDEQWDLRCAKDDLNMVLGKGAKEWKKWCKLYAKKPKKALKK